jgi:hypothetical protein
MATAKNKAMVEGYFEMTHENGDVVHYWTTSSGYCYRQIFSEGRVSKVHRIPAETYYSIKFNV